MKKIFYFIAAVGIAWGIVSCDNEPKNPGDFSVQAYLSIGNMVSLNSGETYDLQIKRSVDTIFFTQGVKRETMTDDSGQPLLDADGNEIVKIDTVYSYSKVRTRFHEMDLIWLPIQADTFAMDISSNARWYSPTPTSSSYIWMFNFGTPSGGGDATLKVRIGENSDFDKKNDLYLHVYTSDSTVYYKIPYRQYGLGDHLDWLESHPEWIDNNIDWIGSKVGFNRYLYEWYPDFLTWIKDHQDFLNEHPNWIAKYPEWKK